MRNRIVAKTPSTMKIAKTTSCVIANGASDWVGANAARTGTFMKSCAIRTKAFRYNATMAVIT